METKPFHLRIKEKYSEHFWGVNAIAAGFLFRLVLYFWNDSLYRDESRVALNIINRSFLELLKPLDYSQVAPIPYLWSLRLAYIFGGSSELYLRLPSLIAGLLSLILFYLLSLRILKNGYGAVFSTGLFAVAFNLILYSVQVKQYSFDVLFAIVLFYLSWPFFSRDSFRIRDIFFLTFFSAFALWFSYSAVFVVGGIILGFLWNFRKTSLKAILFFAGTVFLSFILLYSAALSRQTNEYVYTIWQYAFAPHSLGWWYVKAVLEPVDAMMGRIHYLQYLILTVCIIGFVFSLKRGNSAVISFSVFPGILALVASFLHQYPFDHRLLLFTAPGLALLFGYGVENICLSLQSKLLPAFFTLFIILPYTLISAAAFFRPCGGVKEAMAYINNHKRAGDVVLVDLFAAPTVIFYQQSGPGFDLKNNQLFFEWTDETTAHMTPSSEKLLSALPSSRPVWFIAEASGHPRRYKIGFLRKRVIEMNKLLQSERNNLDTYYTDRVFALYFSHKKEKGIP
jgi:hypothetical protein